MMRADSAGAGGDLRLRRSAVWVSAAGGVGALLLPKCPLCLAAYGGALGTLGLGSLPGQRFWEPLLLAAVLASLALVVVLGVRHRDPWPAAISAIGALVLLGGRYALAVPALTALGAALMLGATVANTIRCRRRLSAR